jgi:hypothetical protein
MNRIAQRQLPASVFERLAQEHRLLVQTVRETLPPSFLSMFPTPGLGGDGTLQWQSDVSGQPRAFAQLNEAQAQQMLQTVNQRFAAIDQAIGKRQAQGHLSAEQARSLRAALSQVPQDALMVVGSEPMVLYWASVLPSQEGVALLPLAPLPSLAAAGATAAAAAAAVVLNKRRLGPAWLWWLLGFLALLLMLLVLWWFYCPLSPRQAPSLNSLENPALTTEEVTITVPPPTPIDPAELWQPLAVPVAPDPPPPPPPPPPPEPEPVPEPVVPPIPDPVPKPKPVAKPAPKPVEKKVPTVTTAKAFCPGERPVELAPEMAVVFDASGSMRLNIATNMAQEREYERHMQRQMLLGLLGIRDSTIERMEREPTRMTVAKNAVTDVLRRLPSDVSVGLVNIRSCPQAESRGLFVPTQRGALIGEIRRLQPEGGTPLADAVWRAGNMLDGRNRESVMLVVTDGQESCGGDPCAVARQLAANKPHLRINVVDIGNSGGGNCLAAATGGKVYSVDSVASMQIGLERAVQDVQGPAHCQ